jgi:hypothetical protein
LLRVGNADVRAELLQERPKTEFSAGYDFLRLTGDAAQNLPSGWYGEIASNMTV